MIDTISLRKKIINLAMRGQLTEQLSSDGDADDLYVFVQQEKEKLIKEGKLKKGKALPDITSEEILFGIPNNWKWVRVGNIAEVAGGTTPKGEEVASVGSIPYFKVSDMNTTGNETHMIYASNYISESYSGRIFPAGTTIFPKNGGAALTNKRRLLVVPSAVDLNTGGCTPVLSEMTEWIRLYMDTVDFGKMDTGANIPTVNATNLKKQLIPLPPLAEQKRIVDKVNNALLEINSIDILQSQYLSDVEVLKSKIIDAGIRGKLTEQSVEDGTAEELYFQIKDEKNKIIKYRGGRLDKNIKQEDEKEPFDIPPNWKWIRFGEVGLFKKGPFGSALTKTKFVPKSDDTIKVYEQQHAINKDLSLGKYYISREYFETKMKGFEVKSGDIIVSCAGTIGEAYIMPSKMEQGIINQALMRVTLVPSILDKFFLYYFDSNLKKDARNKSNGMAIKNIPPFDVMKNWFFPLPPLEEQKRIVDTIDKVLQLI